MRILAALIGGMSFAGLLSLSSPARAFEDTIAQRVQACVGCHGKEGRAAPDGFYPRIAGKPAGYLYNQLRNFRDGRRQYGPMVRLVEPLGDDYLREIATYFARLDLPYPPPQPPTADAVVLARGRELVTHGDTRRSIPACTKCHGDALMGMEPATPALLGLPRDYLNSQLGGWQTGARHATEPDCMAPIAKRLTPRDVDAVSQWLASQPVPVPAHAADAPPPSPQDRPCAGEAR
jgi:cytochrome c553